MDLLADLHRQGSTIVMVTHDPRYAEFAERSIYLFDGQVVNALPEAHAHAAELVGV
jgi:putative ABC transport system ATP-binding protein